jgi:soluble lytic murein transglycosylase-like protein
VPLEALAAMLWQESEFKEKAGLKTNHQGKGIAGLTRIGIAQLIENNEKNPERLKELKKYQANDERMKAAPAISMAAEYLRYNYDKAGKSWPAAFAGYNFGPSRISEYMNGSETYDLDKKHLENEATRTQWLRLTAYLPLIFNGDATRFDDR